jgi:hypothetical protein
MRSRAKPSGHGITPEDASVIRGMLARGDRHHDIAAFFGINQGRIAEIKEGAIHDGVPAAEQNQLPPKGPYLGPKWEWQKSQLN